MKTRGILFKADMVRAIYADLKGQTRRVMKPQPDFDGHKLSWSDGLRKPGSKSGDRMLTCGINVLGRLRRYSPYGVVGDGLYCKETWWHEVGVDFENAAFDDGLIISKATGPHGVINAWRPSSPAWRKRSPLFMFKWATRLWLEITDIRVERVQDISHEDAVAEGCYRILPCPEYPHGNAWGRLGFSILWDSINAKPKKAKRNPYTGAREDCYVAYPWEDIRREKTLKSGLVEYIVGNPWNFAITFKRIDKPGVET